MSLPELEIPGVQTSYWLALVRTRRLGRRQRSLCGDRRRCRSIAAVQQRESQRGLAELLEGLLEPWAVAQDLRAVVDVARLLPSQSDDALVGCTFPRARVPPGQLGGERGELVERRQVVRRMGRQRHSRPPGERRACTVARLAHDDEGALSLLHLALRDLAMELHRPLQVSLLHAIGAANEVNGACGGSLGDPQVVRRTRRAGTVG
eukprot:scaffold106242_cov63-Phaeocystis_antarctica.AAC.13